MVPDNQTCKEHCGKYNDCLSPCMYVDKLADGNVSRKEPVFSEIGVSETFKSGSNYNDVLAKYISQIRDNGAKYLPDIIEIEDAGLRQIALGLLGKTPVADIARFSIQSRQTIYKKIKQLTHILKVKD